MNLHIEDNNEINVKVNPPESISVRAGDTINIAVKDYEKLDNKPSIEGVELVGDMTMEDLKAYTRTQIDALLEYKASFSDIPTKVSQLVNDSGFISNFTETDPTVPAWAKKPSKPSYTASEVGAQPTLISGTNIKTINSESILGSGNIEIQGGGGTITDVKQNGASVVSDGVANIIETDPTVPQWAKASQKPSYTAQEIGALPSTTQIPSKTSDLTNDSGFITLADLPIYNGGVS